VKYGTAYVRVVDLSKINR